jgi:hypothetical protein
MTDETPASTTDLADLSALTDPPANPSALAARGGAARAAALSATERSEIARRAAAARWQAQEVSDKPAIPRATHVGDLCIGDLTIPCAVLSDGTRLLSERGVARTLGGKRGGRDWQRRQEAGVPVFLSAANLQPYVPNSLGVALSRPTIYRTPGNSVARGVPAQLLPEICDVWLKANDSDKLLDSQKPIAARAYLLMRGLATVGIIALVDEATGYQEDRGRDELSRILAAYIAKELLPWTKRFPDEFYEHMFRLRGWSYRPLSVARPRFVAHLTSQLVYEKLPPGVLEELRAKNPVLDGRMRRRHRHHQYLTPDVGNPHLERQLIAVTTLLKAAPNWSAFQRMFARAFPPTGPVQQELLPDSDD